MKHEEYEKLTEIEKACFNKFTASVHPVWSLFEYAVKHFPELEEKRIRELAKAADLEGYEKNIVLHYGGQFIYPYAVGTGRWAYKCMKHSIRIYNPCGVLVACLFNGIQSSATELEPGRIWYSYGDVDGLNFEYYSDQVRAVREAFDLLGYEAEQRGFMDWVYTKKAC